MSDDGLNEARYRLHTVQGELAYHLELFGDELAAKHGYAVNGIEAVWLYLIRTHHWTPAYVKSMSTEDMRFVLSVEMHGFRTPQAAKATKASR